eukprot:gene4824-6012_t
MASGSVAQVHKAVTKDGQVVVVKVLHPHVKSYIKTDFAIIYSVLWMFNHLPEMKWLSLPEAAMEFGKSMMKQINLRKEASNLEKFNENFIHNHKVKFPKPKSPYISKDVLVESFEPGVPIMDYIKNNDPQNPTLARIGLDAYLQMMLIDNFIHADLHPGNVLVRDDQRSRNVNIKEMESQGYHLINTVDSYRNRNRNTNRNTYPYNHKFYTKDLLDSSRFKLPRLVLLDVGLVSKLGGQDKSHFLELFTEIVKGNGREGAELMIKYAREAQCTEEEIYEFKEKVGELFNKIQSSKISEIHVGQVMNEVLNLVREYHVKIESNFATLVMGTIILEGLGKQLDPSLSLFKAAIPFLFHQPTSYMPELFNFLFGKPVVKHQQSPQQKEKVPKKPKKLKQDKEEVVVEK